MADDREYELPGGLVVYRTQPAIGAVVSGIDLARGLDDSQIEGLRRALFAHGVIFLRGQAHIGFAGHLALAETFGTPVRDGHDPERPEITPVRATAGSAEGTASAWHSDDCYAASPPAISILRAIEPCSFGGDTCFSSAVAAYDGLSDELKERIATLRYSSSLAARLPKDYGHYTAPETWQRLIDKYLPVTQPVVIVHPVTGVRALYVNQAWSVDIAGMDDDEGQALIQTLSREFTRPEYQTRWSWEEGAIAIWDNRLVQHYGVPDQQTDRYLERITVEGRPQLSLADWSERARTAIMA
jgi:alpha-ketoglutarate-dependent taurine dioxygenase